MTMTQTSAPANDRVARAGALAFAVAFPTFMAALYFVYLGGEGRANPWQQAAYSAGKALQFAFPVLFFLAVERRLPRPAAPNFAGLGLGLAFGLLVAGGMLALYFGWLADTPLLADTGRAVQRKLREVDVLSPGKYFVLATLIVVVHSLLEEYYWRWFVFGQLRRVVGLWPALVLSSLAFMSHHVVVLYVYLPNRFWVAVVPFSLAVAVGGAFWAWLYARTGTIYSSWLSHLLVDAAIFLVGWNLLQRAGW